MINLLFKNDPFAKEKWALLRHYYCWQFCLFLLIYGSVVVLGYLGSVIMIFDEFTWKNLGRNLALALYFYGFIQILFFPWRGRHDIKIKLFIFGDKVRKPCYKSLSTFLVKQFLVLEKMAREGGVEPLSTFVLRDVKSMPTSELLEFWFEAERGVVCMKKLSEKVSASHTIPESEKTVFLSDARRCIADLSEAQKMGWRFRFEVCD